MCNIKEDVEYGNLIETDIPIYNWDDKAEVAVKQNMHIGQEFPSLVAAYNLVGLENLGITSLDGGKQKRCAYDKLSQYADVQPVIKGRRKRQCMDIYIVPHYIVKEDGRGKNGFYLDRAIPVIVLDLAEEKGIVITTTVPELAKRIGIVSRNYRTISADELQMENPKFTLAMASQLYNRCNSELEKIIFRTLDYLQDEYNVITYFRNYNIRTENGNHVSSKYEEIIIHKAQHEIMKEFGVKTLRTIFLQRKEKEFYKRVCEWINENYKWNWIGYNQQIQIVPDVEALKELACDYIDVNVEQNKTDMSERFCQRIVTKTQNDFERTNRIADEKFQNWKVNLGSEGGEIAELVNIGIYDNDDLKKIAPKIFRYHDNYLEVQLPLIDLIIRGIRE